MLKYIYYDDFYILYTCIMRYFHTFIFPFKVFWTGLWFFRCFNGGSEYSSRVSQVLKIMYWMKIWPHNDQTTQKVMYLVPVGYSIPYGIYSYLTGQFMAYNSKGVILILLCPYKHWLFWSSRFWFTLYFPESY